MASAPVRTCVGCRARRPQVELVRIGFGGGGELVVDRRAPGRGAWLCAASTLACFEQAVKKRGFARTLKVSVTEPAMASLRRALAIRERMEGRGV